MQINTEQCVTLREKCPYLEFFCFVFSHISVFSPDAKKYKLENLRILTFLRILIDVSFK